MSSPCPASPPLALLCLASLLTFAGCAAPLTYGTPAEIVERNKVQVGLTGGVSASSETLEVADIAVNKANTFANRTCNTTANCVVAEEFRDPVRGLYGAGLTGLVQPITELTVLYGVASGFAMGGRLGNGPRAEAHWQFLDGIGPDDPEGPGTRTGWFGTASLAYSTQTAKAPSVIKKVQEFLSLANAERKSGDISVAFGKRISDFGWYTFGARYLGSHYTVELTPKIKYLSEENSQKILPIGQLLPDTDEQGFSHDVGAFASLFVGYKYVWIGVELQAAWFYANARILARDQVFSGLVLLPNLTVMTRFPVSL